MLSQASSQSPDRPWGVFARRDLVARRQLRRGEITWVIKDPISLRYYYLRDEEYAVLTWLDGIATPRDIQDRFAQRFGRSKLTGPELHRFIHDLHHSGLILSQAADQGSVVVDRRRRQRRWAWLSGLGNILALRFRGVDPDRFLAWLHRPLRWCFTPAAVCCAAATILAAIVLVALHFDRFRQELPGAQELLTPMNLLGMAVVLSAVKVLHELGHGLACKHFGGECHEIGLMLLVLTPCLYCNISDSALLDSKWKRAAVAFAGIYVELCLAAVAAILWWCSQPGPLHYLALSTVLVCSLNTLLLNGNPLMKYDGYYVLSELLEIPNLRGRASDAFRRLALHYGLGIEPPHDPRMPGGWAGAALWVYAISSEVYRWVVLASVLWFLHGFLAPYRLEVLGRLLALLGVGGLVLIPLWRCGKFLNLPGSLDDMQRKNLWVALAVAGGLLLAFVALPLPHRIACGLQVQPNSAAAVYVERPGTLLEILVRPGQHVAAGQPLARLENIEQELLLVELLGQRNALQTRLANARGQRSADAAIAAQIPEIEESLSSIEQQIAKQEGERLKLVLLAPREGVVWSPPATVETRVGQEQSASWSAAPFDGQNLGALLPAGLLFCSVGPAESLQAELVVDQADIELVRPGQHVDLLLAPLRSTLPGEVAEIAERELAVAPRQLSTRYGGDLASRTDSAGQERPVSASYHVRVPISNPPAALRPGNTGQARIRVGYRPLAGRLWRWLQWTFDFQS